MIDKRELMQRCLFGGIGVVIFVVALLLVPYSWFYLILGLGLACIAHIGTLEYYNLAKAKGLAPLRIMGLIATWFYLIVHAFILFWARGEPSLSLLSSLSMVALIAFALFVCLFNRIEGALANLATSLFPILYVAAPLGLILDLLYGLPAAFAIDGRFWLIFVVAVTVLTDMGGYFVGKKLGRHRLSPALSPNKTLEGGIGGLIFGSAAGMLLYLFSDKTLPFWSLTLIGFVLSVVGQLGDLAESLLKRDAKVKDSNKIPGLGGVLDLFDSLLFNLPLIYLILFWTLEFNR